MRRIPEIELRSSRLHDKWKTTYSWNSENAEIRDVSDCEVRTNGAMGKWIPHLNLERISDWG